MTTLAAPIVHPARGSLPVVLSVPHSGRDYPAWLSDMAAGGRSALSSLEDPLVDRLVWRALGHGVAAVVAQAPRAAIDCNRTEDEIDPSIIDARGLGRMSARARGGLGIVPSRTQQHGHLWRRSISRGELEERLERAHRPYHRALETEIARTVDRFGCALLIDCHSMPPPASATPPIVFGDCHGRAAAPWITTEASRIAARAGFASALNHPFAGGYVIERHSAPRSSIHALQIEIDRRCYLDAAMKRPGDGFDAVARLLEDLTIGLGGLLLQSRFATAAE